MSCVGIGIRKARRRSSVDVGHELGALRVFRVRLHEQLPGLVVQARLGERNNQQAPDHREDMPQGGVCRPISFQGVDADFTGGGNVGMKNPRKKEPFRRRGGEVAGYHQLEIVKVPFVRRSGWTFQFRLAGKLSKTMMVVSRRTNT